MRRIWRMLLNGLLRRVGERVERRRKLPADVQEGTRCRAYPETPTRATHRPPSRRNTYKRRQ